MVVLFAVVLAFSLAETMREADNVDTERTRQAVDAAVQAQIQQIVIMADDNATWDDAATAVYGGLKNREFLWSSWGISTAESKNYDTVVVLDQANRPVLAYHRGRAVRLDPAARYGQAFGTLSQQLGRRKQPVGGIARSDDGIVLMGLADIMPTDRALDRLVPKDGPYRLFFTRPFNQGSADAIGRALLLEDMELSNKPVGDAGVAVRDAGGQSIATLNWSPARPGIQALRRVLPWILIGAFIHLAIGVLLSRKLLRAMSKLSDQALVDSLSNLPNRRALRRELDIRLANRETVAIALIDLDGFKAVNDNYGHAVGDRLIKTVSELLGRLAAREGMIARLGGDEFAILVTGANAVSRLQNIARAMLDEMSRPFRIDERTVVVGASIGLASASLSEMDSSELMRRADVAMYSAKRAGKMRLSWYDEMLDQRQATAQTIEIELRAAIENGDFEIAYQPVVDIHDKRIVGAEALLRWSSPTRGRVKPSEFIPVAEETGLIDRMGMFVLRQACRDGLGWGDVRVSVNVSAAQLRNPEFPKDLRRVLDETGFPAERLELEITETFLVYDPDMARRMVKELRGMGVSVALDDFGTGVASLGFLRQFSFSKIKLDRSLVTEAAQSETVRTVIQASISVARAFEMTIAAEGIETEAQADMMRVAGCDQLQGWLYSRAVPAAEVTKRVAADFPEGSPRLRIV